MAAVEPPKQERPSIEIDEALREGWFEFWYQPKINLKRKYLAGAEAIARLRHPKLGVLPPGSFEPRLSAGSLERLTEYLLVAALQSWSVFEEVGFNLALSVNVPASVVATLPIAALVERYRPRSDHWPGIILEVAEDQIVREAGLAALIAKHLQIGGIRIAIDNFGAGYSSFSRLRSLPFSELKISQDFVRNCALEAANAAICQTIIDLAHRFGSAVVAEGIESQVELQALIAMGCDFGQGALIAPAMPQEQFLELLLRRLNGPGGSAGDGPQGNGSAQGARAPAPAAPRVALSQRMIPKSGNRFSGKIMRKQKAQRMAGSANGRGVPSGTGMRNTSSVIATMA